VPDEIDANLHDTDLASRLHTVHSYEIFNIECVAVGDISRPIRAQNLDTRRRVLNHSVGFKSGRCLDKCTVNLELSIDSPLFDNSVALESLLFLCGWLFPLSDAEDLGFLAGEELIVRVSSIVSVKLLEEVLTTQTYLGA